MESHAIHGVLSEAREIDLDQRELLHPAPQRVPEDLKKTPRVPSELGPSELSPSEA